ncbi:phytoene/squalene synthase family protein [Nonomuraea maheshkhaliensis]|uniref:Phytoene/squalene synthase family protein n=1 Tax=Nonomuraea maheshkhaliensis TaxID=419590 RepID=A0ABP4R9X1_9ACTN
MTLTAGYERCRRLHAHYGRSYYLATRLLPAWKRRHVHALYGFARYADEIVDSFTMAGDRTRALDRLWAGVEAGLSGAEVRDPVLPAFLHTVRSFGVERDDVRSFLTSMRADLSVTRYATYDDLLGYMAGSAAAIGTMMLPLLEPAPGYEEQAREPARQLGLAFQLTNFLRDVAEDYARGRIYLPMEDLAKFGVEPEHLGARRTGQAVRDLLAFEAERAHAHYRAAAGGVDLLVPSSRPCVRAARELYGGILAEIERRDFEVLAARVRLPRHHRAAIFTRHLLAATAASRAEHRVQVELP